MIRIIGCITEQHDLRLVLLAAAICAAGCYTGLSLLSRARGRGASPGARRWTAAAALVAGATVWTTHFVAMLAFQP